MPKLDYRGLAVAGAVVCTAVSSVLGMPAWADSLAVPPSVPPSTPNSNIFDPQNAPELVIQLSLHRFVLVPRQEGSATTLGQKAIEQKADSTSFNNIVAQSVPGAAAAPSGEIHIRGSHGQYSYYLDGAPLPANVAGSFSDLINPKDIQTLRVYTGGFPAEYGGQLAAIFDVTAKGGQGKPNGFIQQLASGYSTYQTTAQVGGGQHDFSYFLSGIQSSTHFRLSPLTETPLHDAGNDQTGFGKFDYQSGAHDRITLDTGANAATIQVPNDAISEANGVNDNQKENGKFGNLIWSHTQTDSTLRVALYSHFSQLRYDGSPQDLLPAPGTTDTSQLATTFENQKATYLGLRTDYDRQVNKRNKVQIGFDVDTVSGHQFFSSSGVAQTDPTQDQPTILDDHKISGGDRSVYIQDDWTPGRFLVNYGLRYDVHRADITTSQVSPRLNLTYTADPRDKFHAYYDSLFQPVAIESVIKIGDTAPFQPERDGFYEVGWTHANAGTTLALDMYYRTEKNTVDDQTFGNTQIDIPINFDKGYTRGLEASLDGPVTKTLSYYANFARSWAKGHGPITGGLLGGLTPPDYFYDDHDQTNTASFGLAYEKGSLYADLDGEYGSGFPYGELDDAKGNPIALNYLFVKPHTTLDLSVGKKFGPEEIAFFVTNLTNHAYVIKQADVFTDTEWSPGRSYGVKLTLNF